jgi:hypothetical protein
LESPDVSQNLAQLHCAVSARKVPVINDNGYLSRIVFYTHWDRAQHYAPPYTRAIAISYNAPIATLQGLHEQNRLNYGTID